MHISPLSDYPRPQLKRDSFVCLNGVWEYAIRKSEEIPLEFDGEILVPFSPETEISLVNKKVMPDDYLFYKLHFSLDDCFIKDKVILHFGAIDQIAEVFINNSLAIKHIGGFLPFEVDIKPFLQSGDNVLIVRVKDYSDTSYFSIGKQRLKRGNIWYSSQSGIYMPVWLESVFDTYIKSIKISPNIDESALNIIVFSLDKTFNISFENFCGTFPCNQEIKIKIDNLHLWSPEDPYLYYFSLETKNDKVSSYFAMRKISLRSDENGYQRICLNNEPYFIKGVLDQGYFKQGFLTPTKDSDYINDIKMIKRMGFNTLRKHIKIESLRWYYHCDRLGLLVWQDFINGGSRQNKFLTIAPLITKWHVKDNKYSLFGRKDLHGREFSKQEFKDTINYLYNCPCIMLWTIFNEGWGQFDAKSVYNELKEYDKTRLFDHASGWHDQKVSDVKSLHVYFFRVKAPSKKKIGVNRCFVLSECGGYNLAISGHVFSKKDYGYKSISSSDELINEYRQLIDLDVIPNISKGLSAFIYTQLSDVEDELNGFVTYDRELIKVDENIICSLNEKVRY